MLYTFVYFNFIFKMITTTTTFSTFVLLLYNWLLTNRKQDKYFAWILSLCQPFYRAPGQHLIDYNTITYVSF